MVKKSLFTLFLILISCLFISCDSYVGKFCTAEFRSLDVTVSTPDNEPFILDELTITSLSKGGAELDICGNGYDCENDGPAGSPETGFYAIFHDGMMEEIRRGLIAIKVIGKNEKFSLKRNLSFPVMAVMYSKKPAPIR